MSTVKSAWAVVETDITNGIIFIEDICDKTGGMSITNDAENVRKYITKYFGKSWRVVYKDTEQEWWEIALRHYADGEEVIFKRWDGLAWDILKR